MKKFVLLVGLIVLAALPAQAQNDYPKVELFAGYSYASLEGTGDTFGAREPGHGWAVSIARNFHKYFGITADFAGQYGDGDIRVVVYEDDIGIPERPFRIELRERNFSTYQLLFGPRVTVRSDRVTGFAHALLGAFHTRVAGLLVNDVTVPSASESDFAMGFGGGLDINASKHLGIRVFQVDYLPVRERSGSWLQNVRAQAGVVIRFGAGS